MALFRQYSSRLHSFLLYLLILTILGCASEKNTDEKKIIATINGCNLHLDEFEAKLDKELEFDPQYKTTDTAKKEFLETLITKEILIQEAMSYGLDKEQEFISAIEQYWEATLIKNLMEAKNREITLQTSVTTEEVKKRYSLLQSSNKALPALTQIEKEIVDVIKEEKKTRAINQWLDNLKKNSEIEIKEKYL